MAKKIKSWKQTTRQPYQWGEKRNTERYDTPFMCLDEKEIANEEKEEN